MIELLKHSSEAIKGFPMGDSHQRELAVMLPPNYDPKRKEPYPVIFVLAGWGARSAKYLDNTAAFGWNFRDGMTKAMEEGKLAPCIYAFPDGNSKMGCSQYINSPSLGNYMDYICDEMTALVDEKFHTHKSSKFRAVMGHSSGGYAALIYAMKRPDAFHAFCSSAGDSFFEASILPAVIPAVSEIERAGSVDEFLEAMLEHPNPLGQGYSKFITMLTLSLAPCYAPNPSKAPLYGDLFFDLATGQIKQDIWQKYLSWDPVRLCDESEDNLKKVGFLLLECGLQDEHAAQWGHRQLAEKFEKLDLNFEIHEYPGKHSGHNHRYEKRVERILNSMKLT
jgi:S-formylglutathione hydrolase FrmB